MGETPGVADLNNHFAREFPRKAGVQNVGVRGLEVGSDAHEFASDGRDAGRCVGKGFCLWSGQSRGAAGVTLAGAEAKRIREISRVGQSERAELIVLRGQVATETVVSHARAHPQHALFSEKFFAPSIGVAGCIGNSDAWCEVVMVGAPPGGFTVAGAV